MPLDESDIECVVNLAEAYFHAAIADRDSKIEKLAARVAALEAERRIPVPMTSEVERHIPAASYVSDYPDLSDICDPFGKLPQTRARWRQEAERMRAYIGESAFTRIMDRTVANPHKDHSRH